MRKLLNVIIVVKSQTDTNNQMIAMAKSTL